MNLTKKISLVLLLLNQSAFASKALYSITPETSSTVQVPLNSTATINYRVQNQTEQTQSLSLQSNFGITQVVQSGLCENPFTLNPNESCLLSLVVDGSKITASKSVIGPEVCKTNSRFFCSLPSSENRLKVDITSPTPPPPSETHILIANGGTSDVGFISDCLVGASGSLENCQTLSNFNIEQAKGVAVSANQHVYTANFNSTTIAICSFDTELTDCVQDDAEGLLSAPITAYINNNYFYTLNDQNVIKCDINPTTGGLFNCEITALDGSFNNPIGNMTINNGYAYIPNSGGGGDGISITFCSVSATDGTLTKCDLYLDTSIFQQNTTGVTISGSYAYIIGLNSNNIIACEVNAATGELSNCQSDGTDLHSRFKTGIAVLNDYLYVNSGDDAVEKCRVSGPDVSTCESTGSDFITPAGNMTFITR